MIEKDHQLIEKKSNSPIGVFDSGVGGLSVLKEIQRLLPSEQLHYVADSGFAPYGNRSADYIIARCEHIVRFFLAQEVKAIVIACNTATAVAVESLRSWCPVPIVAMEPAIKPARLHTKTGKVGVLATAQTVTSHKVSQLIAEHGQGLEVVLVPCVGFVELVEQGQLTGNDTAQLVRHYVLPLVDQGVDTLVLGCTHYPFLSPTIQQEAGDSVLLIDPSPAVARQLKHLLQKRHWLSTALIQAEVRFWSSGDTNAVACLIAELLAQAVVVQSLPTVEE